MTTISPITPRLDNTTFKHKQQEYEQDPLLKMPVRLLGFTNEVGVALQPVIGKAGMYASWVPALAYIGAAIISPKFRNNEPDNEGIIKRAAFQGMASVLLPTAAAGIGKTIAGAALNKKFGVNAVKAGLAATGLNKFKALKALGGLAALAIAIKPIDKFTEEVIIKKVVEPLYEKFAVKKYAAAPAEKQAA
jgi:hypothetical protein